MVALSAAYELGGDKRVLSQLLGILKDLDPDGKYELPIESKTVHKLIKTPILLPPDPYRLQLVLQHHEAAAQRLNFESCYRQFLSGFIHLHSSPSSSTNQSINQLLT